MGYFGCGTRSNKIGWSFFGVFAVLGVAIMAIFIARFYQCYDDYDDCMTDQLLAQNITIQEYRRFHRSRGQIYWDDDDIAKSGNIYVDRCEDRLEDCDSEVFGLFLGMVLFYVAASIPLYIMCCCSNPPPHQEGQFDVVQLPIQALTARLANVMSFRQKPKQTQHVNNENNSNGNQNVGKQDGNLNVGKQDIEFQPVQMKQGE